MTSKFDQIRATIASLEAVAAKVERFKVNTQVSSADDAMTQVSEILATFRRLKINRLVTAKVGMWRKKQPLVDVVVDFGDVSPRTGQEAGEMAALMNRCFFLVRRIMAAVLPRVSHFCPDCGVVTNGWRFQC